MARVFVTSDTHLQHMSLAKMRGFFTITPADLPDPEDSEDILVGDVQAHDEALIANWNSVVGKDDLVWHLGDVGLGNEDTLLEKVSRLNGHKHLVAGNHDRCWPGHRDARKHQRKWMEVFETVQAFAKIRMDGESVLMSHFPYKGDHTAVQRYPEYRLHDTGHLLLHGHTHSNERVLSIPKRWWHVRTPVQSRQVHVGMEAWNMHPVPMEDVMQIAREFFPATGSTRKLLRSR